MDPGYHDDDGHDPLRIAGYHGLLVHAMIAAALAGGDINPEQKLLIARQAMKAGIETGHDVRYLRALEYPWTPRKLADHCSSEHHRLSVYRAAVLVADPNSVPASGFLEALYIVLRITRAQREALHKNQPG